MTTSKDQAKPVSCPRCGGLMYRPAGSLFYWHADNNHPRCEITNITSDTFKVTQTAAEPTDESPTVQGPEKKLF